MAAKTKQFVVVTTAHRGVFGGYLNGQDRDAKTLTLTDVQMCVYWSTDVQGVLGLAANGPTKSCKITPAVPKMTIQDITSVMDASDVAEEAWKGRPWSR